ncbi:MAG: WbqC family protein [Muribaculaceae bacterium]|nr:WbqC family protein [Muribaculaceae bacterium]
MRLLRYPSHAVLLSPAYAASVDYWAVLCAFGTAVIDNTARFDKRLKSTHRCDIADVNGRMALTIPIEKPVSMTAATWNRISISSHGDWWHQHRVAMESAYGATPFFEFYQPLFEPFWQRDSLQRFPLLTDYDDALTGVIARILDCPAKIIHSVPNTDPALTVDFRARKLPLLDPVRYYQVRELSLGFIPRLSVLDLIFNMGPEAPLILKKMTEKLI